METPKNKKASRWAEGLLKASPTKKLGKASQTSKIYRKPFERRLYLLKFVLGFVWQNKRVCKGYKHKTRQDWEQITTDWNKANPSDTMSLDVLRAAYYRAYSDRLVLAQFLALGLIESIGFYAQVEPVGANSRDSKIRIHIPSNWRPEFIEEALKFLGEDVWDWVKEILSLLSASYQAGQTLPQPLNQSLNQLRIYLKELQRLGMGKTAKGGTK
jgi:hypothetical protein